MKFHGIYRISFYLMLLLSTLIMCMDATDDSKISMLFPIGVALAGVFAFLTVDRNPDLGLPRGAAYVLALGSIVLVGLESTLDVSKLVIALPHWLVYLQVIKMFLPKTAEDDWFLYLLGLMQVVVGAFISQSDRVGIALFFWAVLALWVLGLFSLRRDALRARVAAGGPSDAATHPDEPYPGLFNAVYLLSALRVTLMTMALGGAIFLLIPRRSSPGRSLSGEPIGGHLTGFDEEVRLGQLGKILENDSVVMTVEAYDEKGTRTKLGDEPLWRGVTLWTYRSGRWQRRKDDNARSFHVAPVGGCEPPRMIRQQIKLESNDSHVLFGLRPILDAGSNVRNEPEINPEDGTLFRPDVRSGSYDYRVDSSADLKGPQPGESTPGPRTLAGLRAVPETLKAQLREVAQPIVGQLPPEDLAARARALESFLRDSGGFRYTLQISAVDRKLDPVVDFLINRKEGHCEYFASALALLLRSIDIPARLVNGFKGGDWNEIGQMYCVRQKHAHSWVEAYLGEGPDGTPTWLTLDATPPSERNQSVGQVGGFLANFRQLTDLIRYVWVFYFVGYNAVRQDRFIYEPIRRLANEARKGFEIMGAALQEVASDLFRNRKIESLISVPGFFISFAVLLILVGLFKTGHWLWHPLRRWFRGPDAEATSLSAGVVFYHRLVQLLAEYGLERPPAETQAEFARRATIFLTGRGSGAEDVADVPRLVVDAFYRVRFGQLDLSPDDWKHLEARLDALEASLRPMRA